MPELPEVETMRRGIAGVAGARVAGVSRPPCRLKAITITPGIAAFRKRVVGRTIEALDRIGKRLIVQLSDQQSIVFEPRMTGLVLLSDPPTHEHLRFRMDLEGITSRNLWYWDRRGLGSVRLFDRRQLQQHFGPPRIGPDALAVDADILRRRLKHRRTAIKVALLDQTALAGVGNLYASEILHVARIDPRTRCLRLTGPQWVRLATSMQTVLREAIRYEGSTLADGTYRTALNTPGNYQNHHRVYSRMGEDCPSCGEDQIRRIVQVQRSTFFCPTCQRR